LWTTFRPAGWSSRLITGSDGQAMTCLTMNVQHGAAATRPPPADATTSERGYSLMLPY
jgi:hypothetical protein